MSERITKINDLKQLRLLLTQDEEGLGKFVYDKLRVGDTWWIPEKFTGFSKKERHPWVVIIDYLPNRPPVLACPRTTQITNRQVNLKMPANLLPDLDKDGELIWNAKKSLPAYQFREFEYIGRLPNEWILQIHKWIKKMTGSKP